MTPEQQHIDQIKERLKEVATRGIRQTLIDVQDELWLLDCLLSAGLEASVAEVYEACNCIDIYVSDPDGAKAREKKYKNEHLSEQLSSLHATIGVVICALASVRANADACNDGFKSCHHTDIEPALIAALIRQPQCLDDAAAELAMQQDDNSATATLRRQLNRLVTEGKANEQEEG